MQDIAPVPVGQISGTKNDGDVASMQQTTGSGAGVRGYGAASKMGKTSTQCMVGYRQPDAKNGNSVLPTNQDRRGAVNVVRGRTATRYSGISMHGMVVRQGCRLPSV
jgi:hypothetical protein